MQRTYVNTKKSNKRPFALPLDATVARVHLAKLGFNLHILREPLEDAVRVTSSRANQKMATTDVYYVKRLSLDCDL